MRSRDSYLVATFEQGKADGSSGDVADAEGSNKGRAKPKLKPQDQLIASVTDTDGRIWIPDITEVGRAELQGFVRGFLTAHYSGFSDDSNGMLISIDCDRIGLWQKECVSPL